MALNTIQQSKLNRRIAGMKEEGFFLPSQRSMSENARYLIVGCGGTGIDALFSVKKQFETVLPQKQLEERVRFLAVDTDSASQRRIKKIRCPDGSCEVVELDALRNDQFVFLDGRPARLSLHDTAAEAWIDPQLKDRINCDYSMLNGWGASGIRQIGRLILYASQNAERLIMQIQTLAAQLANGNHDPLQVLILSGIAGGTGSGIVTDLTYLIRHTLESMRISPTRCFGYLLLPPTGNSCDPVYISRGNANGYAAMKEINHFMTIGDRNGTYSMTYGSGRKVESRKNLFDACYLLDGTSDGVAFTNPREKAIAVLAGSILDMVCSDQDPLVFPGVHHMVASKSHRYAVRDADYLYRVLGHSEFAMPIHEIKTYVAKQMFDKIYRLFLNCRNVEDKDVRVLLKNVLRKGAKTRLSAMKSMDTELEAWFTNPRGGKGGPFFTAILLSDLVDEIRNQSKKLRLARIGMASDEELDYVEQYALHVSNATFDVYTAAMDALKETLDDQYCAVVRSGLHEKTYTFIPEAMGSTGGAEHVIKYLDGLITRNNLLQLTEAMLQEMISNREAWTALVSSNSAAASDAIRRFWNGQLDKIIPANLEELLVKYYSGNPEATCSPETQHYLQQAANAIYTQMLGAGGSAQPMAGFTGKGLQPSDFNAHTFLMVPQCAPNLYSELCQIAANAPAGPTINVCTGAASDRIACYKQYTSIPAFKLDWVCDAEADYEQALRSSSGVGLHRSETVYGKQWRDFPNLLPMSTWHMMPQPNYCNPREQKLAEYAGDLFDRAAKQRLIADRPDRCAVRVLPGEYRPDPKRFRELDRCIDGTPEKDQKQTAIDAEVQRCAELLFMPFVTMTAFFHERILAFPDSVLTVGPCDPKPDDWDEYMAKCMLRKMPDVMDELRGALLVMEKLAKMQQSF